MIVKKLSLENTAAFSLFPLIVLFVLLTFQGDGNGGWRKEGRRTAIPFNGIYESELDKVIIPSILKSLVEVASWYGEEFHGKLMANGEPYDMNKLTVAYNSRPLGTRLRIENPRNGRQIVVTVTDHGNMKKYGRNVDLSKRAAEELGLLKEGWGFVRIEPIYL